MQLWGEPTKHDRGLEAHFVTTLTPWEEGTKVQCEVEGDAIITSS